MWKFFAAFVYSIGSYEAVLTFALEGSQASCAADGSCDEVELLQHSSFIREHATEEAEMAPDFSGNLMNNGVPPGFLYVPAFAPYPGYSGNLEVEGSVTVEGYGLHRTAKQVVSWKLHGLDPECKTVPQGVGNACGIHIHQGKSCYENANGHYWNSFWVMDDPWKPISYTTKRIGKWASASEGSAEVVTGWINYDVLGHTMIVHDHTGARVACGIIAQSTLAVRGFIPYLGYEGNLAVSGEMGVLGFGVKKTAGQQLMWNLQGVDKRCCSGANSEFGNSCGVHIHAGTSCREGAEGHFWNKTAIAEDPWKHVTYKAIPFWNGKTVAWEKEEKVVTALTNDDVDGHTMIVHDYEGARVACGIISPCTVVANAWVPYFNYCKECNSTVHGYVQAAGSGFMNTATYTLSWDLQGVDKRCDGSQDPISAPYACTIQFHEGKTCIDYPDGRLYDPDIVSENPWSEVRYKVNRNGDGTAAQNIQVLTGFPMIDALGDSVIIYNADSAQMACGRLVTSRAAE